MCFVLMEFDEFGGALVRLGMERERYCHVDHEYLKHHSDIKPWMRRVLIDWIIQVYYKIEREQWPPARRARDDAERETVHMATMIIDAFLAKTPTLHRSRLQLAGMAALLIASKFEDVSHIDPSTLVFFATNAYTTRELFEMEDRILFALDFRLFRPTPFTFTNFFLGILGQTHDTLFGRVVHFLLDLAMMHHQLLQFLPSQTALVVMHLAARILEKQDPPESNPAALLHLLDMFAIEFREDCEALLVKLCCSAFGKKPELQCVQRKHASMKKLIVDFRESVLDA